MKLTKYVACIYEGSAERAILELLLDAGQLIFSWDDLLEEDLIQCRSARNFEEQYLRKGFREKITSFASFAQKSSLTPQELKVLTCNLL